MRRPGFAVRSGLAFGLLAAALAACGREDAAAPPLDESFLADGALIDPDNADNADDAEDAEDIEDAEAAAGDAARADGAALSGAEAGPARRASSSALPDAAEAPARRDILRFAPAVIVDPNGFDRPMAAATLFVPAGWRAQGGVVWDQRHMCVNGYNFDWSAAAPDGAGAIAILPQAKWEQNSYGAGPTNPGCGLAPYTDARSYLEAVVASWKPGARVTGYRRRPDVEKDFASHQSVTPMPMGEIRNWVEAGEVSFDYAENGRAMRGSAAAAVLFSMMLTDAGMGPMRSLTAFSPPGYGALAPAGAFNPALFEAIRRSIKPDPNWSARISGHNVAIGRVALEESRKRARMINESNEEIARIRQEAWAASQESADRRAREFGELLRGVETYRDADAPGGEVELSHMYSHAWRLKDGTYVLTNDANFDPWRDLRAEGSKLDPVR